MANITTGTVGIGKDDVQVGLKVFVISLGAASTVSDTINLGDYITNYGEIFFVIDSVDRGATSAQLSSANFSGNTITLGGVTAQTGSKRRELLIITS